MLFSSAELLLLYDYQFLLINVSEGVWASVYKSRRELRHSHEFHKVLFITKPGTGHATQRVDGHSIQSDPVLFAEIPPQKSVLFKNIYTNAILPWTFIFMC